MKTIALILMGWLGTAACTSAGMHEHSVEHSEETRQVAVIPLKYAVAAEVAGELNGLRPDTRVIADQRTNSVIVSCATEAGMRQLGDCIARLDAPVMATQ